MFVLPRIFIFISCLFLASCVNQSTIFAHKDSEQLRKDGWPELQSRYLIRFSGGLIAAGGDYLPYHSFALSLSEGAEVAVRVDLLDGSKRMIVIGNDNEGLVIGSNSVLMVLPLNQFDGNGNAFFNELGSSGSVLFKGVSIYFRSDIAKLN